MIIYGKERTTNKTELKVIQWLEDYVHVSDLGNEIEFGVANFSFTPTKGNDREIDLILVGKAGLFILEIKDYTQISVKNGAWYTGSVPQKDPFGQANKNFYDLFDRLIQNKILGFAIGHYAVIFPSIKLNGPIDPSYHQSMYLDSRTETNASDYLKELIKLSSKQPRGLSNKEIFGIKEFLAPNYNNYIPDSLSAYDDKVLLLGDEQLGALNALNDVKRMILDGPAGSGKTVLALQMLKQKEAEGIKTLYVCYNKALAAKMTYDIDRLLGKKPIHTTVSYIEKVKRFTKQKFDYLIADEAQDYLNDDNFVVLDSLLKSGIDKGSFRIFLDYSQDVFGQIDHDFLKELRSRDDVVPYHLIYNFRNTLKIRDYVENITGLDVGIPHNNPEGEEPQIRKIPYKGTKVDYEEYAGTVSDLINTLLDSGVAPKDIMVIPISAFWKSIVSDRNAEQIKLKHNVKLTHSPEFDWNRLDENKSIVCGSAYELKGIDSPVVICTDIFDTHENEMAMLVGMTRARTKLYLFVGQNFSH